MWRCRGLPSILMLSTSKAEMAVISWPLEPGFSLRFCHRTNMGRSVYQPQQWPCKYTLRPKRAGGVRHSPRAPGRTCRSPAGAAAVPSRVSPWSRPRPAHGRAVPRPAPRHCRARGKRVSRRKRCIRRGRDPVDPAEPGDRAITRPEPFQRGAWARWPSRLGFWGAAWGDGRPGAS
jgi:hypothetical protein